MIPEPLNENPSCARTYATFRLVGDALSPDEVTTALGVSPTQALAKGDDVPGKQESSRPRRSRTGIWLLGTKDVLDSTSLERHLLHLLAALEPVASVLDALRTRQDLEAEFFCYWLSATGQGGPALSPPTLRRISALDASLRLDIYGPYTDSD